MRGLRIPFRADGEAAGPSESLPLNSPCENRCSSVSPNALWKSSRTGVSSTACEISMSSGTGVSSLSRLRPVTRLERIARRSSTSAAPATPATAMYLVPPCIIVSLA